MTPLTPQRTAPAVGASGELCLEDLYEHAPCGYLLTEPDGAVVKANETFLLWSGYSREEVLGRSFAELLTVGSQLFYETRCLPILRLEGAIHEVALVLRCANGRSLSILVNSTVRYDSAGLPQLLRLAIFDATKRQDYERDMLAARRAAELSESRLRVLQQASSTFDAAKTAPAVTAALAECARTAFDATSAAVLLLDDRGDLQCPPGSSPLGDSMALDAARPEAEAFRLGTVVTISSVDEADRTFPSLTEPLCAARLEAMTAVPLLADDDSLGVLVCFFGRRRDFRDDEIELHRMLARQAAQVLQRIRLQEQLQHLAMHDKLTGLANRELLQHRLVQVLAAAPRNGRPVALIFLDLDGFKAINDQLGHAVGDAVLVQVAQRLNAAVRAGDVIARFGGDEFVVVCEDADRDAVAVVAERIRLAVRSPLDRVPSSFSLTASIGIAQHCPSGGPAPGADAVVFAADTAMYVSKRGGKDRYTAVDV